MNGCERKPRQKKKAKKKHEVDILHISDKLVIALLTRTIWSTFPLFLIFCYYFTRLNPRKISRQNMRNLGNIGHIVLETVQQLMPIKRTTNYHSD